MREEGKGRAYMFFVLKEGSGLYFFLVFELLGFMFVVFQSCCFFLGASGGIA